MRLPLLLPLTLCALTAVGQEIRFDQAHRNTAQVLNEQRGPVFITNQVVTDTLYVENIDSGTLTMVIDPPRLTRVEYDAVTKEQVRRIGIRQESAVDSTYTQDLNTGASVLVTEAVIKDIPSGDYVEYHSNGSIRTMGTLDGFDQEGKPRKVGEWTEWDADGNIIHRQTYP